MDTAIKELIKVFIQHQTKTKHSNGPKHLKNAERKELIINPSGAET